MQPDAGTEEPDLSSSVHTIPHSRNPHWTVANSEDHMLDIQSYSSKPNVNPPPLHSRLNNVEQEFIPLIHADGNLHGVQAPRVEDTLNKKNADLKESFAKSLGHVVAEDDKVKSEHVAGSETKTQDKEEVKFDDDDDDHGDKEDDDEGDDKDEEEDDDDDDNDDSNDEDDFIDNVDNNASVDSHDVDVDVTVNEHLEQVNDENAKSKDVSAGDLSQPTAVVKELSSSAVNGDLSVESGSHLTGDQHSHPVIQKPAKSSSYPDFEQESGSQSDADVRQVHSSGHFGMDFGHQQADVNYRGYWRPDNQPIDFRFPGEFNQHLPHSSYPVWKHVQSPPVEEFGDNWPKMQEAYRSRPELTQEQQRYMNDLTDDNNIMQHHQQYFLNHQRQSHIRSDDGRYFQNQRTQFNSQDPRLFINHWRDEDAGGHPHFGDMRNSEQRYDHSDYNQEAAIRRPSIHVDQVYRQHPFGQRYMSSFGEDTNTGPVHKRVSSVSSSEQSGGQTEFLTLDSVQRFPADKLQSEQLRVDHDTERPSSAQWSEKDTTVTDDSQMKQASTPEYYGDAGIPSSSQKYADEASPPPSPLIDRSSEHASG